MDSKKKGTGTPRLKRIMPMLKKSVIWAVKTPVIRIVVTTGEQKVFIYDANKFLEPSAIKPEYRNK